MIEPTSRIDLASEKTGARVLAANDEFFARKENLIKAAEPIFIPDKYVSTGKWMDGWETRRRREPGHDWCLIRLGLRGLIEEIVVDTAFFRGNYPAECSIEACDLPGQPDVATLRGLDTHWTTVVPRTSLQGDSRNRLAVAGTGPFTHLLLNIYPDGGVARLRVFGRVTPDWDLLDFSGGLIDLAAAENGGLVGAVSDDFFGHRSNLIMPGTPRNMADGWETRRRRGPGHDWAVIMLGARGPIERVELDTSHFKGNAPGSCWLEIADELDPLAAAALVDSDRHWRPLLTRVRLQPHLRHQFVDLEPAGPATHVRLHIDPDGGVARLRLWGRSERARTLILGLGRLNALPPAEAAEALLAVCGSRRWAEELAGLRPFVDVTALMRAADLSWRAVGREEQQAAFAAHPRIGERGATAWSRQEQAGVELADADVLAALADANTAYEARFGRVFLICATGKHAGEMLAALRSRLGNDPDTEHAIAAEEQRKITRIRLERWLRGH